MISELFAWDGSMFCRFISHKSIRKCYAKRLINDGTYLAIFHAAVFAGAMRTKTNLHRALCTVTPSQTHMTHPVWIECTLCHLERFKQPVNNEGVYLYDHETNCTFHN